MLYYALNRRKRHSLISMSMHSAGVVLDPKGNGEKND